MKKNSLKEKAGRKKEKIVCIKNEREFFNIIDNILKSQGFELVEINPHEAEINKSDMFFS